MTSGIHWSDELKFETFHAFDTGTWQMHVNIYSRISDNIINLHQNCFKELKYMQKIEVNKMVDFSEVQYFLVLLDQMKFQARFLVPKHV